MRECVQTPDACASRRAGTVFGDRTSSRCVLQSNLGGNHSTERIIQSFSVCVGGSCHGIRTYTTYTRQCPLQSESVESCQNSTRTQRAWHLVVPTLAPNNRPNTRSRRPAPTPAQPPDQSARLKAVSAMCPLSPAPAFSTCTNPKASETHAERLVTPFLALLVESYTCAMCMAHASLLRKYANADLKRYQHNIGQPPQPEKAKRGKLCEPQSRISQIEPLPAPPPIPPPAAAQPIPHTHTHTHTHSHDDYRYHLKVVTSCDDECDRYYDACAALWLQK